MGIVVWARRNDRGRRVLDWLAPLATATRRLRGAHGARMLGLTLAIWALEALTYLAVADSVDLQMTPLEGLYMVALVSVFILIPSGPGYLGTFDAAVLFGVDAIGGSGGQGISYLLMLRFILLVPVTIAGLILLVLRYGGLDVLRRPGEART
jgi:uncharacterized membrane protein YbhN (UPF0104 family)